MRTVPLEAIDPKKHPKYSENLLKWLKKRGEPSRRDRSQFYFSRETESWILGYDDGDGYVIGSHVNTILCDGAKAESFAFFKQRFCLHLAEGMWNKYAEIGRCAFDPAHRMHFQNSETRWLQDGDTRTCQWCNKMTQKRKVTLETRSVETWDEA